MIKQSALRPVYDLTHCATAKDITESAAAAAAAGWLNVALRAGVWAEKDSPATAAAHPALAGLPVSVVHAPGGGASMNWGTRDLATEADALAAIVSQARALGVPVVTVSPGCARLHDAANEPAGYVKALRGTLDVMRRSVPLLEQTGISVGLEVADHGFLLSPMECRELLDRINSPYVGASLSGPRVAAIGWVVDWVRVLGRRIISITSSIDRLGALDDEVRSALTDVGFNGPVLFTGNPTDAMREARHWISQSEAGAP